MSKFEINKGDQVIIGLDISGSMRETDCPGGMRRYDYALESVELIAKQAGEYDPDGVSIHLFGAEVIVHPDVTHDNIRKIIAKPDFQGGTRTALVLRSAYEEHKKKGSEQTFLIVFTDGEPSSEEFKRDTIKAAGDIASSLKDPMEFRIAVLTVGKRSDELQKFLDLLTASKHTLISVMEADKVDFLAAAGKTLNF